MQATDLPWGNSGRIVTPLSASPQGGIKRESLFFHPLKWHHYIFDGGFFVFFVDFFKKLKVFVCEVFYIIAQNLCWCFFLLRPSGPWWFWVDRFFLARCNDVMLFLPLATPGSYAVYHSALRLGWSRGTLGSCACLNKLRGHLGDFVVSPMDLNVFKQNVLGS